MGPIEIVIDKIKAIADAIRAKTGTTAPLTLDEMAESIEFLEGDGGGPLETFILVDEDGHEMALTLTEEEVPLTATANDIRKGTVAVTDAGVITGEKIIPSYNTTEGHRLIPNGSDLVIYIGDYDYTKLQAIVCPFNSTVAKSVAADKVAIEGVVYPVQSSIAEATVLVNHTTKSVNFGITNTSGKPCLIRYFSYKEIY